MCVVRPGVFAGAVSVPRPRRNAVHVESIESTGGSDVCMHDHACLHKSSGLEFVYPAGPRPHHLVLHPFQSNQLRPLQAQEC